MRYVPGVEGQNLKRSPFKALVVPRPIAWVSTLNENGTVNLAPFSFFNGVSEVPPCVMFAGTDLGESGKDTVNNVARTGEFVVNIATYDLRIQVRDSGKRLPRGQSELAAAGLSAAPSHLISTSRVAEAKAALECRWIGTIPVPGTAGEHRSEIVLGEVVSIYIEDGCIADGKVQPSLLKPLSRLGYNHYASVEGVFEMSVFT
jgi:flavin reductase (DIM6/NTAB) family NADH-FMN oxidoreductase RutF